jgi:hypothetical protein
MTEPPFRPLVEEDPKRKAERRALEHEFDSSLTQQQRLLLRRGQLKPEDLTPTQRGLLSLQDQYSPPNLTIDELKQWAAQDVFLEGWEKGQKSWDGTITKMLVIFAVVLLIGLFFMIVR